MKRIKYYLILLMLISANCLLKAGINLTFADLTVSDRIKADTTFRNLTVVQADSLIDSNIYNPDFRIIDVRTPSEYGSGHLEHAININFNASDFDTSLDTLDKTKVYLIYCQGGSRSGQTFTKMRAKHFVVVYNMLGGFTAWHNGGYPYVTNTPGIEDEFAVTGKTTAYPNPASSYFYIETGDVSPCVVLVTIVNLAGEKIIPEFVASTHKIKFDASGLKSGLYIYSVSRQGLTVDSGKIQIIK